MLWKLRLREVLAILFALAAAVGIALLYRWRYATDDRRQRLIEAEILSFSGHLSKAKLRNLRMAWVRLPDGRVNRVRWPDSARASHCRAGDRVRLISYDFRVRVWRDGCYPSPRDPNPPPFP
ncbi:MAG: hypothetical protein AB7O91_10425 [Sphingomonas sp.]